jgi:hypothetical protein
MKRCETGKSIFIDPSGCLECSQARRCQTASSNRWDGSNTLCLGAVTNDPVGNSSIIFLPTAAETARDPKRWTREGSWGGIVIVGITFQLLWTTCSDTRERNLWSVLRKKGRERLLFDSNGHLDGTGVYMLYIYFTCPILSPNIVICMVVQDRIVPEEVNYHARKPAWRGDAPKFDVKPLTPIVKNPECSYLIGDSTRLWRQLQLFFTPWTHLMPSCTFYCIVRTLLWTIRLLESCSLSFYKLYLVAPIFKVDKWWV